MAPTWLDLRGSGHAATTGGTALKDVIIAGRGPSIEHGVNTEPAPTSEHRMRTLVRKSRWGGGSLRGR
jgi:hypothetical protein